MVGVTLALLSPNNSLPLPSSYFDSGSTTVKSVDGLALNLFLNSTRIRPGQGISITVQEENTLSTVNNVSAYDPVTNQWEEMSPLPASRNSGVAAFIDGLLIYSTGRLTTTTYRGTIS